MGHVQWVMGQFLVVTGSRIISSDPLPALKRSMDELEISVTAVEVSVLCLATWREAAHTFALWRLSGPGIAELEGGYRCVVSIQGGPEN